MKISDYLGSDVLSVIDRDIQYLENKIKVFAIRDIEYLDLIDFTRTRMAEEEK